MKKEKHCTDLCIVGGGMAGMLAAIAAARHGCKVILIQDRPILGGNASSEVRMHICGAHGSNMKETGILEEIQLDNLYYNSCPNFSVWDSILYGKAQYQENLSLLLNCTVNDAKMERNRLKSVTGWQMTTETFHEVEADLFADCSGDGILAPLSGADFRIGREARAEFNESIAPEQADEKTMGMSCLFQVREYPGPQPFKAPPWAYKFTSKKDLNGRSYHWLKTNFWWLEVGGDVDSIHDTERCREELVKIAFGVWDFIKNYSDIREEAANWALDWQGFLPGKRESRRYLGDHVLTQNDIEAEGKFEDIVAYGGWSMDDHFPAGFHHPEHGTIFHPAPSPFGIPYRSLYSRNIENLFCAGRCHSATHAAMSATRVMGTTSIMGQAVGTAAAIATANGLTPREVYQKRLAELKKTLMDDDCYLPFNQRAVPELSLQANLTASGESDPQLLRNGIDRPVGDAENSWTGQIGDEIIYSFNAETALNRARIVFDSNLNRPGLNMHAFYPLGGENRTVPETLVKAFRLEIMKADGSWETVCQVKENHQRLVKIPLKCTAEKIKLVLEKTHSSDTVRIFAFDVS